MQELEADAIYRTLTKHGVDFLIVGGMAVAVHGFPRATKDVDIVPDPLVENLERLMHALEELEARPLEVGDFNANEFPELSVENLAEGGSWCLRTKFGRLDVLQYVQGVLETAADFDAMARRAFKFDGNDGELRAVGFEDLVRFKERAGRDVDLADLRALYEARGDTGPR